MAESDATTVASTISPPNSVAGAAAGKAFMSVSVIAQEVVPDPTIEFPTSRGWPATTSMLAIDKLAINLDVDIAWQSGHHEGAMLALVPQAGARVAVGGLPEDAERWNPLMLSGEQTLRVQAYGGKGGGDESAADAAAAPTNIMRASCEHGLGMVPEHGADNTSSEDTDDDGDDSGQAFTVTGGKAGLGGCASSAAAGRLAAGTRGGTGCSPIVMTGFIFRTRLSVTATLYVSHVVGVAHTVLVSGTGTLEMRPRLVELHKFSLPMLLAAAQADTKRGENFEALQKWRHALPMQEREARVAGGKENTKLATLLHSMGVAYTSVGNAREALACLRRALAIRQHVFGEEHPESARTQQALGVVRVRDGEYHEAFEYFWQALRYYEAFDPDSLDAASTLGAVAGVYGKLGEYSEALECYLRALVIQERELGRDHLDVATTLHNLGVVSEKLSDHTEALESLQRAAAIRKRQLGGSHPMTARTLHSIGIVYSQVLDYDASLASYRQALEICQRRDGEGTHAAATLNNMGVVYAKLGQTEAAIDHHKQALTIQESILGPEHPDTVATRYNLQVLETEAEEAKSRSYADRLRALAGVFCSSRPRGRMLKERSIVALLCEENDEVDGPLDEPFCCSTSKLMHCGAARPVSMSPPGRREAMSAPGAGGTPRMGFPEQKKRAMGYPAAGAPMCAEAGSRQNYVQPREMPCKDDCKLSL